MQELFCSDKNFLTGASLKRYKESNITNSVESHSILISSIGSKSVIISILYYSRFH